MKTKPDLAERIGHALSYPIAIILFPPYLVCRLIRAGLHDWWYGRMYRAMLRKSMEEELKEDLTKWH